ncbi:2-phosphoglycerate kinase [Paenibacillus sp. OV219]|uniref:2-phosphoglycerate kinase n=1 Tax=Paenibacillus sp. OV219 TaxID=1884377 RepID=UPI0008D36F23|nr:2-phosphoglycerate kinase [Paenibacillus sp. OV219]SEN96933.1 putative acetyltransferase [Paenibacillus sp. OV219]
MIILISGNSQMGKTYMAQKLLETYKIPYYSIDHLKMGIYRGNADCGFTPMDSNEHIGDRLWPILKGIIMTAIENQQSLVIEGCYILPHYLQEFDTSYLRNIIPVFLGFSNRYIMENYEEKILKYRNIIENRGDLTPEDSSDSTIEEYLKENDVFRRSCAATGEKFFEIDRSYEDEITRVYEYIAIRKEQI